MTVHGSPSKSRLAPRLRAAARLIAVLLGALSGGCGGRYVRGYEEPGIDDPAMSTRFDKRDLEVLFNENSRSMVTSRAFMDLSRLPKAPFFAIFPVANETSEHVGGALGALLSRFESELVADGRITVISHERQDALIEEVRRQNGGDFDARSAAKVASQLGAQYFVTGKLYDTTERSGSTRRVQYYLFMQLVEVETGVIRWQNEADLTKAYTL